MRMEGEHSRGQQRMSTVLVVDDKEMMRDSVAQTLRRAGFEVVIATDGPAALRRSRARSPTRWSPT
jgi:CheY-like chemotaxis protein